MPCVPFEYKGMRGFICGPKPRRRSPCQVKGCATPHEALCDHPHETKKNKDCDFRMCEHHRHQVGPDKDLCPAHFLNVEKGRVLQQLLDGPRQVASRSPRFSAVIQLDRQGFLVRSDHGKNHMLEITEPGKAWLMAHRESMAKMLKSQAERPLPAHAPVFGQFMRGGPVEPPDDPPTP